MRLYLSAVFECSQLRSLIKQGKKNEYEDLIRGTHILASFAYHNKEHEEYYPLAKSILMDSGAFTYMGQGLRTGKVFDAMAYCKKYATYVKEHNIENFIELDVEGVTGFKTYVDCLHQLQDITGKDPIYVYHKWRGIEYYKELVKKHHYVCLGDVDTITRNTSQEKYFKWFVDEAHKYGTKVHGLAFTKMDELKKIPFDSVDSSSWSAAARFASLPFFNGRELKKVGYTRFGNKTLDAEKGMVHSYIEWKKLSQYWEQFEGVWNCDMDNSLLLRSLE